MRHRPVLPAPIHETDRRGIRFAEASEGDVDAVVDDYVRRIQQAVERR
jgi:hypothetical protein